MGLKTYNTKRNFKKTHEPKGKISHKKKGLFTIQKHAASHLHYDFRIELDGVLLSWAVPKGPCLDPKVKRLAIHVEDHPVSYGAFEGIIPKGEYGAGAVMVWDTGFWKPLDEHPAKAYKQGHLRFELDGQKLKGRWDLFRFNTEKEWFLVKHQDEYAKPFAKYDVIEAKPRSVLTNQTITEIAKKYEPLLPKERTTEKQKTRLKKSKLSILLNLNSVPFPDAVSPQLATLVYKAPAGDNWLHEIKFDGYRIISFIKGEQVVLKSRSQQDWSAKLFSLTKALKKCRFKNVIFDGEVVVLDKEGKSNFQLLQNTIKARQAADFVYYIFDLLYYDNMDLRQLPLIQRKQILRQLLPKNHPSILYSDYIINEGETVFHKACELALEGIISKKINSPYEAGRSKSWLKIKCTRRQEFVIGGYTTPKAGRFHFGSLYLGLLNEKGELDYVGKVGTGFTDKSLKEIYEKLQQHRQVKNPFHSKTLNSGEAHWVNPLLIAEVEFTEWTVGHHLRHPSFKGLKEGSKNQELQPELSQPSKKTPFEITHADKILYPEDNISKQDVLVYYDQVSDYIAPFIQNRPLSLVRCPENYQTCFFQKHYNKTTPKTLKSVDIVNQNQNLGEPYIYLDNKEGLLSLVQMGVLEIHPWASKITTIETPDYITIDLDPAEDVRWKQVVAAAFDIRLELEQLQLKSFVKTTGGKGLHIVIPIQPDLDWKHVKNFTRVFVNYMGKKSPSTYICQMAKSKRSGKIFLDYLRNQRGATAVSAYSTRSRIHAPVSVPIEWDELTHDRRDTTFTIKTLPKRLNSLKKDPWHEYWKIKQWLNTSPSIN